MLKKIFKESRPATLTVALLSTSLGIVIAYKDNYIFKNLSWDLWKILLVTIAGLLLQSGVNLINNFFEEDVPEEVQIRRTSSFCGYERTEDEILIFRTGLIFFIITALIGFYLSLYSGPVLLIIELLGIFSAYAYAGKPFNYKKYGLGALMSFIMMGPLMVFASYYVFAKEFSSLPILYSFTMGLYIPAILLANEIRDYEEDKRRGIGTLTVRMGFTAGKVLYYILMLFSYINILVLIFLKYIPLLSLVVISTTPMLLKIPSLIKNKSRLIMPQTAKIYLLFGVEFLFALLVGK